MLMLYNSDNFAVMQFEVADPARGGDTLALTRGGYEIVDKFARKEIFIEGAMAESFKQDVQTLIEGSPSEEEIDDFLGRFSSLMQQPLVMH
jgi:hypothetical protein